MDSLGKDIKKLQAHYDKKLRKCHKDCLRSFGNGLDYFINYLRYLRDYYTLSGKLENVGESNDVRMMALVAAISEYEKSQTCIRNYYREDGVRLLDESPADVLEKYNKEKATHWGYFWQLVMLNIESWTANA